MARSSRNSQAATRNAPTLPDSVDTEKTTRSSTRSSTSKRNANANGDQHGSVDSQEATRRANELQENVFLFVPNLIGKSL